MPRKIEALTRLVFDRPSFGASFVILCPRLGLCSCCGPQVVDHDVPLTAVATLRSRSLDVRVSLAAELTGRRCDLDARQTDAISAAATRAPGRAIVHDAIAIAFVASLTSGAA
jgi:hypothetical protein